MGEEKKITVVMDMKQAAYLGAAMDHFAKATGMQFLEPAYEIQQQIKKQLPAPPKKKEK